MREIPTFDELPIRALFRSESSWGVFDNEALGCLSFLTPEGVVDAARLVTQGKVFRLDAKIGFAKPPLFGRAAVTHTVIPLGPTAHDDMLDSFNTQEGSQWDGLGHVGHFRLQRLYNGVRRLDGSLRTFHAGGKGGHRAVRPHRIDRAGAQPGDGCLALGSSRRGHRHRLSRGRAPALRLGEIGRASCRERV